MTIPRRPGDLQPIGAEESLVLLSSVPVIRLAFVTDHGPTILPVNHVVLDGEVYFRTETGTKLAAAAADALVAVEADALDADEHLGWSVVAHGRSHIVTDEQLLERLHSLHFSPWSAPDAKLFWIHVAFDEVGGRRIVAGD